MGATRNPESLQKVGIDASLIEANLRLSPEQRALKHQAALELVMECERQGAKARGRPEAAAGKTRGR
jgi:hypothetical protein